MGLTLSGCLQGQVDSSVGTYRMLSLLKEISTKVWRNTVPPTNCCVLHFHLEDRRRLLQSAVQLQSLHCIYCNRRKFIKWWNATTDLGIPNYINMMHKGLIRWSNLSLSLCKYWMMKSKCWYVFFGHVLLSVVLLDTWDMLICCDKCVLHYLETMSLLLYSLLLFVAKKRILLSRICNPAT